MVYQRDVSKSQAYHLRTEALLAGDNAMVDICETALGAFSSQPVESDDERDSILEACAECARLIADAEAQG